MMIAYDWDDATGTSSGTTTSTDTCFVEMELSPTTYVVTYRTLLSPKEEPPLIHKGNPKDGWFLRKKTPVRSVLDVPFTLRPRRILRCNRKGIGLRLREQ